jgi:5-methylthioadenosine/S-adenosylhomocysteine deaminase
MIRFYNGRTLSFGGGVKITADEVWTEDGVISYVGPARADMPAFERQIDLRGDLVMPSFKDAHTHSAMTFLRSYADDLPLHEWLYDRVFPREAKLTPENIYDLTRLAILEYVSGGITASFDMYMKNDAYAAANIDSGFRTVICGALNDFDKDPENIEREYLKFNSLNELVGYRLGIHAEYTTGMERMKYMAELVHKYKAPFYTHNSETKAEVEGCAERWGTTPTALFESLGMFDFGGGGFHCVWFSDEDMEIFKKRGLWCVTNPASNLKLASGVAPICRMMDAGIGLAIGTDGPASNNALDMFREMYLVTALQKYVTGDASACPADKVLEMACAGGARAMGIPDCDDIAPGKKADLIVIDMARPNMQPENNIAKNLVYAGSKDDVRLTMINGRILYENGEFFIGAEPGRIYEKANAVLREMEK